MGEVNVSYRADPEDHATCSRWSRPPRSRSRGTKWQLTAANLSDAFWARAERLTALRRAEQDQMQEYVDPGFGAHGVPDSGARRRPRPGLAAGSAAPAGHGRSRARPRCDRVPAPYEPAHRATEAVAGRRSAAATPSRGRIPKELQAQPGKALCVWGDAGWGASVRHGKYHDGRFSDDLVEACRQLVEQWGPDPAPMWVTCVPSRRHPDLVPDFARRLAGSLGLAVRAGPREDG